jgi:hypothetical protein
MQVQQLRVWRDIYYLDDRGLAGRWERDQPLADDELAVLGDNQPVSIDSRHWDRPGVARSSLIGLVYKPFFARPSYNLPANTP